MGSAELARAVLYDWTWTGRNRLDSGTSLGSSGALPWRGPWRHAHSNPPSSASVSRESERGPLRSTYFQPASPRAGLYRRQKSHRGFVQSALANRGIPGASRSSCGSARSESFAECSSAGDSIRVDISRVGSASSSTGDDTTVDDDVGWSAEDPQILECCAESPTLSERSSVC